MGWSFYPKPDNVKADLDRNLTWTNEDGARRVLRSAIVRMRTYYAAVEHIRPDGSREVWAAVSLLRFEPKAKDGYTFGHKDMSEHMGPHESECPEAILDLLTEPRDDAMGYARLWRERCRANIARRKSVRLHEGATVKLRSSYVIAGKPCDTFTARRYRHGWRFFTAPEGWGPYKLIGVTKHIESVS